MLCDRATAMIVWLDCCSMHFVTRRLAEPGNRSPMTYKMRDDEGPWDGGNGVIAAVVMVTAFRPYTIVIRFLPNHHSLRIQSP